MATENMKAGCNARAFTLRENLDHLVNQMGDALQAVTACHRHGPADRIWQSAPRGSDDRGEVIACWIARSFGMVRNAMDRIEEQLLPTVGGVDMDRARRLVEVLDELRRVASLATVYAVLHELGQVCTAEEVLANPMLTDSVINRAEELIAYHRAKAGSHSGGVASAAAPDEPVSAAENERNMQRLCEKVRRQCGQPALGRLLERHDCRTLADLKVKPQVWGAFARDADTLLFVVAGL